MRLFSTAALSLALVAGAGLVVPGAALAAKKKDKEEAAAAEAAAGQPRVSAAFFKAAKEVQDLLTAKDFDGAVAKLPAAEASMESVDDHYFMGNFYLSAGLGKQDLALQLKGLEMMLDSGKVAPADVVKLEMAAGGLAASVGNGDVARAHFAKGMAAGADVAQAEALIAESYFSPAYKTIDDKNQFSDAGRADALQGLPHLRKAIDAQVATGTPPPLGWYERGLQTAIVAGAPDAFEWGKLTLSQTDKPEDWRMTLRVLQEANRDMPRGASIDLLRLMQLAKALKNDYSYSELTEALWKAGLPGEVKAVIDAGEAAGDITKSRYNELYKLASDAIPGDKASLSKSAANAAAAATGRLSSATADAYLSYGEYDKAAELYRSALQKGGVDSDEVNTRLGIALARSGDLSGAKAAFGAVAGAGVRKQVAELWEVWIANQANAG